MGFREKLKDEIRAVAKVHHVWVNTICLTGALLGYNVLSVVRRYLGQGGLLRLFLLPLPEQEKENP